MISISALRPLLSKFSYCSALPPPPPGPSARTLHSAPPDTRCETPAASVEFLINAL